MKTGEITAYSAAFADDVSDVVVVGNGPSRSHLDLTALRGAYPVVGCNALYRDHPWVDALGVVDPHIAVEAFEKWKPTEPQQLIVATDRTVSCGMMMLDYAATTYDGVVYLLGFDFTRHTLYAGTENYERCIGEGHELAAETPPEWLEQLDLVMAKHPGRVFVQVRTMYSPPPILRRTITWECLVHSSYGAPGRALS